MALPLNTHQISGIFALNQWFKVKQGSFYIDSYNLRDYMDEPGTHEDEFSRHAIDYQMGAQYEKTEPDYRSGDYGQHSSKAWCTPQGSHGCCFIDLETSERVSLSLLEIRAFRERIDWTR